MTLKPLISIIVPVLNEEDNIRLLIEHVDTAVSKLIQRYDFEYVFTDNHSSDGTADIAEKCGAKVIKKDRNIIPKDLKFDFRFKICFVDIISAANIQN